MRKACTMHTETEPVVVVLDANVFLAVLLPDATKAGPDNVRGAERLLRSLNPGTLIAVTPAMTLAEVRWAFARSGRGDHLQAYYTLVTALADRVHIMPVTAALAYESGALRARYYSKANDVSYIDALCLATAFACGAAAIVSTDPHLLRIADAPVVTPSTALEHDNIETWLGNMRRAS